MAVLLPWTAPQSALGAQDARAKRIQTSVSIAPLADFVRQVGGSRVDVLTLIPPGASPHTYALKPSQVQQVAQSRLLVLNGSGLEYWAEKLIQAADNPRLQVLDTSQGISLLNEGMHGANPHIWLDVRQAMVQVQHIRGALIKTDPTHRAEYERNTKRFLIELGKLDQEIIQEVKEWRLHSFVAFHPAWIYFARRYGLKQVAVIEKSPGHKPSPAKIAQVIETAKRTGIRAIFAEPQFSPKLAQGVAEEADIQVSFLDPLGSSIKSTSYIAMMRYNLQQMAEVMR